MSFRPPAVPLVTHDPYFSAWSFSDLLTETETRHWTGTNYGLSGLARVDGQTFRLIGTNPRDTPPMMQTAVDVLPTRTVYQFEEAGIHLSLSFLSPLLPDDLDILARPVSYLTWEARATDGRVHDVSVYFHVQSEWVVNTADQHVISSRFFLPEMDVLRMGSAQQQVLEKAGDDLRIDWGYLFLAVPRFPRNRTLLTEANAGRRAFVQTGTLPEGDEIAAPRPAHAGWPVLACVLPLGDVSAEPVRRHVLLAYDDVFSVEYFHRKLRPYWRRKGMDSGDLLKIAAQDYESLSERCLAFDAELMGDLRRAGGEKYALLCALAYRQCIAAHKLAVDYDGSPLFLSKENFSNGCIATVDVTYPSAPFFLLLNPELLRAMLTPILTYAESSRWRFPYAPHDLGTYPLADGQVYGGGERSDEDQMPVEECGNVLILVTALTVVDGHADYAERYWPLLTRWAEYLRDRGLDPENQLCTDDFAGHLAHNVNLSLKAILALGCYALLCRHTGRPEDCGVYFEVARAMVREWTAMADDGDHSRLAFDKPDTWSQKYNLIWDPLLGLGLFPPEVAAREVAYYKTRLDTYGLPLDSREPYAKLDWTLWSASLAENPEDFHALADPLYDWANETDTRVPLADWYWTHDGRQVHFQARSVVGALYLPLLKDTNVWWKWVARSKNLGGPKNLWDTGRGTRDDA